MVKPMGHVRLGAVEGRHVSNMRHLSSNVGKRASKVRRQTLNMRKHALHLGRRASHMGKQLPKRDQPGFGCAISDSATALTDRGCSISGLVFEQPDFGCAMLDCGCGQPG